MTLRAIGFHEAVSAAKLEEVFRSDRNQLFGGTVAGKCSACGARFAVFFPAKDDADNPTYLGELQKMIARDCKDGKHGSDYSFKTTP